MRRRHYSKSSNRSENRIPLIPAKAGFDTEAKPWTSDEKNAIKDYHEKIRKTTL